MTKFIFAFSILALTIGCSSASSRSSGNDEGYAGGDAGSSSTAGSGSGSVTGSAGSGTETGGAGGSASIGSQIDNACLAAGLDDKHPACGSVGDVSCSCPSKLECGGVLWDSASNGTPAWEANIDFELLMNRFTTNAYTKVCGEGCVNLSNFENPCRDSNKTAILCGTTTTQPSKGINCALQPETNGIWCCDSLKGDYAFLKTDYLGLD